MSVKGRTGRRAVPVADHIFTRSRDLFVGLIASVITIAYGLSFAALIFAPPLNTWLAYGIAATFIAGAISAAFVAVRSSIPFAIAAPDGATSAVTATLAATVAERLIEAGPPDDLIAPVMIVVAIATALTGILLFGLGLARAGGAIRFIPYPVIGGFLSATGWPAMHSFTQIKYAAEEAGVRLVLVNPSNELRSAFRARGFITEDVTLATDLDRALETCEEEVIAAHSAGGGGAGSLRDWLTRALGSAEFAEALSELCERLEVDKGQVIARQGEPAGSMHFILEGRVGIIVEMVDGRTIRVRSLGPHTTIGEMGLISRQMRSATIQAEVPSVLYELTAEAYERLKRENSALAQALLTYTVRVMAERLSFASRVIGVLRR